MEGRKMTTRSSRYATLPVSPIKQAVMANVMGAGKSTSKRSSLKALADKTNATPVARLVPSKSPKNVVTDVAKSKEEASTPSRKMQSLEQLHETSVLCGEDLLRFVVHNNLSIVQTLNGLLTQSSEAKTPQFGVPLSPCQGKVK